MPGNDGCTPVLWQYYEGGTQYAIALHMRTLSNLAWIEISMISHTWYSGLVVDLIEKNTSLHLLSYT